MEFKAIKEIENETLSKMATNRFRLLGKLKKTIEKGNIFNSKSERDSYKRNIRLQ